MFIYINAFTSLVMLLWTIFFCDCYVRIKLTHPMLDCILACLSSTSLMSFLEINSFVSSIAFCHMNMTSCHILACQIYRVSSSLAIFLILFLLILMLVCVLLVKICSPFFLNMCMPLTDVIVSNLYLLYPLWWVCQVPFSICLDACATAEVMVDWSSLCVGFICIYVGLANIVS